MCKSLGDELFEGMQREFFVREGIFVNEFLENLKVCFLGCSVEFCTIYKDVRECVS